MLAVELEKIQEIYTLFKWQYFHTLTLEVKNENATNGWAQFLDYLLQYWSHHVSPTYFSTVNKTPVTSCTLLSKKKTSFWYLMYQNEERIQILVGLDLLLDSSETSQGTDHSNHWIACHSPWCSPPSDWRLKTLPSISLLPAVCTFGLLLTADGKLKTVCQSSSNAGKPFTFKNSSTHLITHWLLYFLC